MNEIFQFKLFEFESNFNWFEPAATAVTAAAAQAVSVRSAICRDQIFPMRLRT